ncbi:MAG: hypothetical protein FWD26_04950 [Treponema sp.]|nr:hypothetical protein [Treponema sp.]
MNVNNEYRKTRSLKKTSLIASNPDINDYGFSIQIADNIEGIKSNFEFFATSAFPVIINNDMIAITVSALVLEKYNSIYFAFDVGKNTLEQIKSIVNTNDVHAEHAREDNERQPRSNWVLNFSGGTDSTLLRIMCPELVPYSIEFETEKKEEGNFLRVDSTISKKLGANSVITNARECLFPHYPIGYYNLGSLLFADKNNISLAADGRLMTDSIETIYYMLGLSSAVLDCSMSKVYDVQVVYPLIGMTWIGSNKLLYNLNSKIYNEMKDEYFSNVTPSFQTKYNFFIDEVITGKTRKIPYLPDIDILGTYEAPYIVKKIGVKKLSKHIKSIPEPMIKLANSLSLDFYEKYDPKALEHLPPDFSEYFQNKLKSAGMQLYTKQDYAEREQVFKELGTIV